MNLAIVDTDVCMVTQVEQGIGGVADTTVLPGQAVARNAQGLLVKASAVAPGYVTGVLISNDGSKVRGTYLRQGIVDVGSALATLPFGAPVYLSDTPGMLSDTPGTVSLKIGEVVAGHAGLPTSPAEKLLRVEI